MTGVFLSFNKWLISYEWCMDCIGGSRGRFMVGRGGGGFRNEGVRGGRGNYGGGRGYNRGGGGDFGGSRNDYGYRSGGRGGAASNRGGNGNGNGNGYQRENNGGAARIMAQWVAEKWIVVPDFIFGFALVSK